MITITKKKAIRDPKTDVLHEHFEGVCESSDTKPSDWPNGSKITEIDTGKNYMYSAASASWIEHPVQPEVSAE